MLQSFWIIWQKWLLNCTSEPPQKDGKKELKQSMRKRKHYQLSTCLPVGIEIVYTEAFLYSPRRSRRLYFIKPVISNNVASAPNCRKYTLQNTEGAIKMGNPEKLAT